MNQVIYDITLNVLIIAFGFMGLNHCLNHQGGGIQYLMLAIFSSLAVISSIVYLGRVPKLMSMKEGREKDIMYLSCNSLGHFAAFAVVAQCVIIICITYSGA